MVKYLRALSQFSNKRYPHSSAKVLNLLTNKNQLLPLQSSAGLQLLNLLTSEHQLFQTTQ